MSTTLEAIDCASTLTKVTAAALKNAGISAVGRYLGKKNTTWWKTIGPGEAKVIHDAGLAIFLIWEGNPINVGYFTYAKGVSDAKLAADEMAYLGVPKGTAIYFTVDYDAQPKDMIAIIEYFRGVRDQLAGQYLMGAYGSYSVMAALSKSANPPDRYYQTYAWSKKQVFPGNHIYQYQNDITLGGVAVDRNKINCGAGTWPELKEKLELKEEGFTMEFAVAYYTSDDYSLAKVASDILGGCAMFCRNGKPDVHPDFKKAKVKYVIGGPKTGLDGEVYMSGETPFDTVIAFVETLKEGR